MFEDSLLSSRDRQGRSRTSWIVAVSLGVQAATVAAFVVFPLFYPAGLPMGDPRPKSIPVTLLKRPEIKVQPKPQVVHAENTRAISAPSRPVYVEQARGGSLARATTTAIDDGPPAIMTGNGMTGATSLTGLGSSVTGTGPVASARPPAPAKEDKPLAISAGVMAGRLLHPIEPAYPRIAIMSHTQGTVIVTATIDRQGRITGLRVLSGPEMLRGAAVDAVKEARYEPFLLNGQPTEVTTTITVNFRMSS
jgi:protein TonB